MFISEVSYAKKLLNKAYDVHRRGEQVLARHLFAIARRAIRKAKEYVFLDLCLNGWNQHTSEPTEELNELEALRVSLSDMHVEFADFCNQHRL